MKKTLNVRPVSTFFLILILSLTSHSQELSVSYLSKEIFGSKTEELRKEYGKNKIIPPEIELECLTALSYFPELKNTSIVFKFGKPVSTMVSRPRLSSTFKRNEEREYQVLIRKVGSSKNGLELDELSFNSLVGWIAHELSHIVHYDHKGFAGVLLMGIKYALPGFRRRMERFTDQLVIKHNLGYALYEGTDYSINYSTASQKYKKNLIKFYLSPAEIKNYIKIKDQYKLNFQATRIVDINSIAKTK
jgi:hypothetical protein